MIRLGKVIVITDKFFLKHSSQIPGPTINHWLSSISNNPDTQHIYVNLDSWNYAWDIEQCDINYHNQVQSNFRHIENITQIFACGPTVRDDNNSPLVTRDYLPMFETTHFEIWPAYQSGKLIKHFKPSESDTVCDVITEPVSHTQYFTLNTIHSILNQRPFIITSAPGMNHTLKRWGFQLFDELFEYDLEPLTVNHESELTSWWDKITAPLQTLTPTDITELRRLWAPKCRHNLQRLKQIALSDKYIPDTIKPELLTGYPGFDNYYETLLQTRHLFKTHSAFKDI